MNKVKLAVMISAGALAVAMAPSLAKEKNEGPNWRAAPVFTTANLAAGFNPDPWTYDMQAGGSQAVSDLGAGCGGYINFSAPDIDLNYEAGSILPRSEERRVGKEGRSRWLP